MMRGETATENEAEAGDYGESAAAADSASGERRPSIVKLQNMLRKVSHSPLHGQYKTLVSTSDSSGSSANDPLNKQDGDFLSGAATDATDHHQPHSGQNGDGEDLPRTNPFYTYYLESGSKGHVMEDVGRKTSEENLNTIFVPPPDFQSSPLELKTHFNGVENGAEPQKDPLPVLSPDHTKGLFQTSAWPSSANGHFQDLTLSSPDLFTAVPAQTKDLSETTQSKSSDMLRKEGFSIFRDEEDSHHTAHTREENLFDKSDGVFADPFKPPSNNEVDLFGSPQNPFHTIPTKSDELFQAREKQQDLFPKHDLFSVSSDKNLDIFSPSFTSSVDPFPSPITRDLFQDVSSLDDPFSPSPSNRHNHFQDVSGGTPDLFRPLPAKASSTDIFAKPASLPAPVATHSAPSLSSPSEIKLDTPDFFNAKPSKSPPAIPPKPSNRLRDIVLTTPEGTNHVLQPTPFTRARNLSMSPSQSPAEMTHVPTFKRPPKPLPRTRPPSKEKPPRPERPPKPVKPPTPANPIEPEAAVPQTSPNPASRPFPKPVIRRKPKTPESKSADPQDYVVFEDILLIGQEKCVEDWPEDSPELHPDFKPSGTLRLRRESLKMKGDSDGGSGEDQDGQAKKKDKKFRMSLLSRRGSKEKFDDTKEGKSRTLPISRKSSKEYFSDAHMFAGEPDDGEQNGIDKKKHLTTKVNQLIRRASTTSSVPDGKHMNGFLPQESKDDALNKKSIKKNSIRRWSEGRVLDDSTGEEEEGGHEEVDSSGFKRKKKVKIRFVPHRGFAIIKTGDEPQGAHGYTPRKGSKDDAFENVEALKDQSLQSPSMAAFVDDEHLQKTSLGLNGDGDPHGMEDHKPKKPPKMKLLHGTRRSSKEDMLDHTISQKKKSSFSGEELDDDQSYKMEDCKPKKSKFKVPVPVPRKTLGGQSEPAEFSHHTPQQAANDPFPFDDVTQTEKDFMDPSETYEDEQDELETCKPKKLPKLKGLKKHKNKSKGMDPEWDDPPGATSRDYMSEAAKAEWKAAQMDERAMAGMEDEDEEGDTDSLMEWWYTVEQWDEVPSDDEDKIMKEDVSKSFTTLADKVQRGLRVFNKVFTERAEVLWQYVIRLHAIADDISNFHQKAKIAGITGGTTTAVGGVTAIAGLALAPFTLGASLVITAVGVGVATAGGITSASAAISDNVNNMHDRKKVEIVLEEYEAHLLDIGKILHFVNEGVYKLRGHPFLRSGTQHYSEDWEVRRAVQMISLVDSPVMRATEITDTAVVSVQGLFRGMDKYFVKDSRELKKGCKKEVVAQIKEVANVLNDGLVELNAIREELQDATGNM